MGKNGLKGDKKGGKNVKIGQTQAKFDPKWAKFE